MNAQFARPSYKKRNWFPFMVEGKRRLTLDLNLIRELIFLAALLVKGRKPLLRRMQMLYPILGLEWPEDSCLQRLQGWVTLRFSTAFGGLSLFPSLFNIQFQGFPDATVYGTTSGFPYGVHGFHGYHTRRFPPATTRGQHADNVLKNLLFLIGFLVVLALLWW
ncbi:RING ZINC FINGER PROTEIN-RELATED [Salix purpurea]|uniref:RING ZINC FINGER PROTEIN-RELATED n=1 Tax=Salix purpurea TaxID=77065 RepID=A0A9Q1AKC8_SALPP|nr:RING ZINC FINGER PROTEIN-RELATED [Salix purpurea]